MRTRVFVQLFAMAAGLLVAVWATWGAPAAAQGYARNGELCGSRGLRQCLPSSYCAERRPGDNAVDRPGVCTARPQVCTQQYDPVCGADGRTYSNSCTAAAAGVSVARRGQCGGGSGPLPPRGEGATCGGFAGLQCRSGLICRYPSGRPSFPDQSGVCTYPGGGGGGGQACTREYRPVCGVNGQTYPNSCEAGRAGVGVRYQGQCRGGGGGGTVCPTIYQPVCGTDGRTYGNSCEAGRAGVGVRYQGQCRPGGGGGVQCPAVYDPVCGTDGQTYSNSCRAGAAGVGVRYRGQCRRW